MIIDALLKPLLPRPVAPAADANAEVAWRALQADPALAGRVTRGVDGAVVLTGAGGGPAPDSLKERQRWELHVRLRLAVELGDTAGETARLRWARPEEHP